VEFRILGPLEVWCRDVPVPLSGPREHRLLALLLLSANHLVPMSFLIDAMWDDRPPATAKRQVQNGLSALRSRLRSAGAPATVVGAAGGYRINVDDGQLDAQRFDSLVRQARDLPPSRDAERARMLRVALALWRGPALAGLTGRAIEAAAARLDEQRLTVHEHCLDVELRLDRHEALVSELSELVAANPLRERPVGQLMLALYRSSRQADALKAYLDLRSRLADELGIDPSAVLQRLHLAILRHQTSAIDGPEQVATGLPAPPSSTTADVDPQPRPEATIVPRQLPAVAGVFVGRRSELGRLDRLAAMSEGADAVVIAAVTGTAGIGKTATAVFWAHGVAAQFPDGQLYLNLRGFAQSGVPMPPAEAVRTLLDALGVRAERIPVSLDAQLALYRSLLAGRRMLVVLDNARDTAQVRPLLPGAPGCLVVVTSRDQLAGLTAIEGAHHISLGLLSTIEAKTLLGHRLGPDRVRAEPQATADIIARCAGLPLALVIVAAQAAARPGFPLSVHADELSEAPSGLVAVDGGDPASDVQAVFSWSYRTLSADTAKMFRLLGVHRGPDITAPAATSLAGLPAAAVRRSLDELVHAHLVAEHVPGRFALHDLLRRYAAELAEAQESDADRHAAIHRMLDHYLQTAYRAMRLLHPHREEPILPPSQQPGVVPEAPADHRRALDWFAVEHPVLLAVVEQAATAAFDVHTWQLAWTMASYLDRQVHWSDQAAVLEVALDAARRLGDRAAQARARRLLARAYTRLGRYDDAHIHLRDALEMYAELGDDTGQAHAHFALGSTLEWQGNHGDALGHARRALDLYRAADDRTGQANTLNAVGWCHALLGNYGDALAYCREALILHQELNHRHGEAYTWDTLGYAHHGLAQHLRAVACYQHAIELSRDLGDRQNEADVLTHLGDTHHTAGNPQAARESWQAALNLFDELGHPEADHVRAKLRKEPT
jgi:DNA-binding SARP family transcriptional activator/tetratricopeptide (TPR) repeat protein